MKYFILVILFIYGYSNFTQAQVLYQFDFEDGPQGFTYESAEIGSDPNCGIWHGNAESLSSITYNIPDHSNMLGFNIESGCGEYIFGSHILKKDIIITDNYPNVTITFDYIYFPDLLDWIPGSTPEELPVYIGPPSGMNPAETIYLTPNSKWEQASITFGRSTSPMEVYESVYELEIFFNNSAMAIDNLWVVVGAESSENLSSYDFQIFPNPVDGNYLQTTISNESQFKIFNVSGSLCLTGNASPNAPINISELAEGSYYIQIQTKGGLISKKFVKF